MGHSFGRPLVSKLPDGRWAVFLTSGYNNTDNKGYLYVLDANDGSIIHTIATAGSGLREINNFVRNPATDNTHAAAVWRRSGRQCLALRVQ
jgi:Tfp pilus tip-associated adhesin PilY1